MEQEKHNHIPQPGHWCGALLALALTMFTASAAEWNLPWKGAAPDTVTTPPKLTQLTDAPNGGKGIVATVTADGEWQGIGADCPEPIDFAQYSVISFDFKQNFYSQEAAVVFSCRGAGKLIYTNFTSGKPDVWRHVEIPLDPRVWSGADKFGMIKVQNIGIYPFAALNKKGQYLAIANLKFIPKTAGGEVRAILPRSYQYGSRPDSGDDGKNILTDGDRTKNAYWRNYGGVTPEITFDLGTIYAVTKLQMIANPDMPEQNFTSADVQTSMDGKTFHAAGSIGEGKMVNGEQVFELSRPFAGRYVKVFPKRKRQDFPIWLSEIQFTGFIPTSEQLQKFSEETYDTGRPLPPDNGSNYAALQSGAMSFKVCKENGVIADLKLGQEKIAEQIFFQYTWEDKKTTEKADSWADKISEFHADKDKVSFVVANAKYPGMSIQYTYRIDDQAVRVAVRIKDQKGAPKKFFSMEMNTVFAQAFRKNGVYEAWGACHALPRVRASEVVTAVPAGTQAALIFESYDKNLTLMQLQDIHGGIFLPPGVGGYTQHFLPNGMLLASAPVVLGDGKDQQLGFITTLDRGTELAAYDHYLDRPEMKQFMASIHHPAWLRDVKLDDTLDAWEGHWIGGRERAIRNLLQCYDNDPIMAPGAGGLGYCWGDFAPSADGYIHSNHCNSMTPEETIAEVDWCHKTAPHIRLAFYHWIWSADPNSRVFNKHPEWFVTKTRNDTVASLFPGSEMAINYTRLFSLPDAREAIIKEMVDETNDYHLDTWYLDGGGCGTGGIDWDRMIVDEPTAVFLMLKTIREQLQKTNPDRTLFFNTPYDPQGDFGYLETFTDIVSNWRSGVSWMYKFKLFQHRNPLHYPVLIYWFGTTDGPYQDYMLGTGLLPSTSSHNLHVKDVGYVSARYEVRQLALADADPQPNWRSDAATDLELMTLKQFGTGYAYMKLHAKEADKRKVSFQLAPMDLDPAKPVHQWLIRIKNGREYKCLFGEPALRKGYEASGWISDRVVTVEYLGTAAPQDGRLEAELDLKPNEGTILAVSQTPAVIWSYRGRPAYSRLAGTPAVQITGDYPALMVNSEDEGTEIAMIVPEGKLPESIKVNGKETPWRLFKDNGALLAIVKLDAAGKSAVECAFRDEAPLSGSAKVQARRRSKSLTLKGEIPAEWVGKTLLVTVSQGKEVCYSKDIVPANTKVDWSLALPEIVRDGAYQVTLTPAWGDGKAEAKCSLYGIARPTQLEQTMANPEAVTAEKAVDATVRGMQVTKTFTTFTKDSGAAAVDLDKLCLTAGSGLKMVTYWNKFASGVELKNVKRYLKVRCFGNLDYNNTYSTTSRGRHSVRYDNPWYYLGLALDFGTAKGYTVRTMGSYGICKRDCPGKALPWGYQETPQHVWRLNTLMDEAKTNECTMWLDLEQLGAPEDWNGEMIVSVLEGMVSPERRIGVEILETADQLPAGADTGKPVSLKQEEQPRTMAVPKIQGEYKESVWASIPAIGTLRNIAKRFQEDPNPVTVKVACDAKNIYFFFDNQEAAGKKFEYDANGMVYMADSVEVIVSSAKEPGTQLHLILAPNGESYLAKEAIDKKDAARNQKLTHLDFKKVMNTANPEHWTAVVIMPFQTVGVTDPAKAVLNFNMMRNRKRNGTVSYLSLAPTYFSGDFLKLRF